MDWKLFASTFLTIFVAEIGDKTQFAALAVASQAKSIIPVWLGVVLGLAVAGTLGVVFGKYLSTYINPNIMRYMASAAFFIMGTLILLRRG